MNKPVTKLLKSKSSNGAITMKSDNRKNKKTNSNVDFQTSAIKKRGVYVENKDEKLDINVQVATQSNKLPKPPPRPRPGKKGFLASVLTILSKSTVGTQYPDPEVETVKDIKNTTKQKSNKKKIINCNETTMDPIKEKKKYKSRILNHKIDDKLVILQSTKEIINTPSMDSEQSQGGVNNALKPSGYLENYLRQGVTSAEKLLAKEVLEGKQHTKEKIRIDNDPSTLVADINNKDDKGLYNFFVDLLETTFSVYNLKAEHNDITADVSTSKLDLEICESVAERLNILEKPKLIDERNQKPTKRFYCIPKDLAIWDDTEIAKRFTDYPHTTPKEEPSKIPIKRRLKSNSFNYSKKLLTEPKSEHFVSKRKTNKAKRKKSLLNSLKEQLRMEDQAYEEPQNIFVALKLIARNKRKYEKSIRFLQHYKDGSNACRFQRRKVISPSTRSTSRKLVPENNIIKSTRTNSPSVYSRTENKKSELTTDFDMQSRHSLQVYGFDDVSNAFKRQACEKEITLTYHSSLSLSDHDYDPNETLLEYTDSDTSSVKNLPSGSRGLRFVS